MKNPNLSVPIDNKLHRCIGADARRAGLSRADIVRQILRRHYGLIEQNNQSAA